MVLTIRSYSESEYWVADFIPSPNADALIANSVEMREAMEWHAKRALGPAQDMAPVKTGAYRDGLKTDSTVFKGRACGLLIASDFKSVWIEFGTSKWPAHAVLRRACDAARLVITAPGKEAR